MLQSFFPLSRMLLWTGALLIFGIGTVSVNADDQWVVYKGGKGPGQGKTIVLVSGDEEYRSEEALPQLGKMLAKHHGFQCTVLFAIDPKTGYVNPNVLNNIPGLKALESADLMIIFTRFRNLPDDQMKYIDDYLKSGKPVIGIRTATHGFKVPGSSKWHHYDWQYTGKKEAWRKGFGKIIMGETWVSHHGAHKDQSTYGVIPMNRKDHPIVRGIKDGDIWGPTDVYGVNLPLPGNSQPIVLGQVMNRKGERDNDDPFYGLRPNDGPPDKRKNDPMMPIAWTKTYQLPGGKKGKVFASTIGASTDLVAEGTRRMYANAVYWILGMEDQLPQTGAKVDLVGKYEPSAYITYRGRAVWNKKKISVSSFQMSE
ncbi:MAG: ThuA domain-containing protein [Gemmataceae bacterium]